MADPRRITSEDALVQTYLRPLTEGDPGASDLLDDAAILTPSAGCDLILTKDAIIAGVHFHANDAPADIAWKALAVNVCDLAAKGADPIAYLMTLGFPEAPEETWIAAFSSGLAAAQKRWGLHLLGGDTVRNPYRLMVDITAIGSVPFGRIVKRSGATPGDQIVVSGTLGDAALALLARNSPGSYVREHGHLDRRYLRPEPRTALIPLIRTYATAAMDLSDGLVKDLTRLCKASSCAALIEAAHLPLSNEAQMALDADRSALATILTGGDDYEILMTVASDKFTKLIASAQNTDVELTRIGEIRQGVPDVAIYDADGSTIPIENAGYDHF